MKSVGLSHALMVLITVMLGTGYVNNYSGGTIIILLVMMVYLVLNNKVVFPKRLIICILLFFVYIGIKSIHLGGYRAISQYHSIVSKIEGFVCTGALIIMLGSMKKKMIADRLIKLFLLCYHFVLNLTMMYLLVSGDRSVYRNSGSAEVGFLAPGHFVIFAMIFSLTFMYLMLFEIDKKRIGLFFFLFLDNAMFVTLTEYMTQLIFIVMGVGIMLILKYVKKKSVATILFALCCMLPFIMPTLFSAVLRFIGDYILGSSADFAMRMDEIIATLNGGLRETVDLQSRIELQNRSLNVFYEYPLFGIPFEKYNISSVVIGGHVEWFDMLGRLGIVGTLLWGSVFYPGARYVMADDTDGEYHFIVRMIFFVYGFFNPFLSIFFFIGLLYASGTVKHYEAKGGFQKAKTKLSGEKLSWEGAK